MENFMKGTCEEMCSKDEQRLRTKERMVHFYEMYPNAATTDHNYMLVKAFSRSAAGLKQPKSSDLRTPEALKNTVTYLFRKIFVDTRKPYNFIYDFIFDRLRSVRQEIVMQNIDLATSVQLVQPMIMFLAYSRYRLCEESLANFDTKICEQHLQECLKTLLWCYDEIDRLAKRNGYDLKNRIFFECLYLLFNLGSPETLNRATKMHHSIRTDELFHLCFYISLNYFNKYFYKILIKMDKLPHILCSVVALKLQHIRRQILCVFSVAYQNKILSIPLEWLQKLLLYSDVNSLVLDCRHYNLEVNCKENTVKFSKIAFNESISVIKTRREDFVDRILSKENISNLILSQKS